MGPKATARLLLLGSTGILSTSAAQPDALDRQFSGTVQPFITRYCAGCHSGTTPAAQLDLHSYTTVAAVVRDYPRWNTVIEKLTAGQMPPRIAPQPPENERKAVIGWIQAVRADEIHKNGGDPGTVLARRLSNSEYNYTIRDLT